MKKALLLCSAMLFSLMASAGDGLVAVGANVILLPSSYYDGDIQWKAWTWVYNSGVNYEVYYMPVDASGAPVANSSKWTSLAAGKSNSAGYVSVDIKNFAVPAGKGAIGIAIDSGNADAYDMDIAFFGTAEWMGNSYYGQTYFDQKGEQGESYIIRNGQSIDLFDYYYNSYNYENGATAVIKVICSDATIGDVNGDGKSSTVDALLVLRNAIGLYDFDSRNKVNGDTNFDGKVAASDALLIQRHAVGLISEY